MQPDLLSQFGNIDIYLFDQLLRGRITPGMRILDAGCGGGRNLVYLLREGYAAFAVDRDPLAIEEVQRLAAKLAPSLPPKNFQVAPLEAIPFADASFDVVICSALLHFAADECQFNAMLKGFWRKLRPGGFAFCRLASSIGIEKEIQHVAGRRFLLPDGSERYLVDASLLEALTTELGAILLDPIKTSVVHNQRSMTTWVIQKRAKKRPFSRGSDK
jgi:SAM-dependent methyltransferase